MKQKEAKLSERDMHGTLSWVDGMTIWDVVELGLAGNDHKLALHSDEERLTYSQVRQFCDTVIAGVYERLPEPVGQRLCILTDAQSLTTLASLALTRIGALSTRMSPGFPKPYIRSVLQDLDVALILTTSKHLRTALALADERITVLNLDECAPAKPQFPDHRPDPDDAVWVTFTSGSTGRPKGAVHSHRSVLSFTGAYIARSGMTGADHVAELHRLRGMDSFAGLLCGATIHSWNLSKRGFSGLGPWLSRNEITILPTVPTALRRLAGEFQRGGADLAVRLLRVSGEKLSLDDGLRAAQSLPDQCELMNWYGCTEAGIACFNIPLSEWRQLEAVPAGTALPGLEIKILDSDRGKTPAGNPGEIVVGGEALFKGYWKRPDLDAAKFSLDSTRPDWRWFKTGDLGHLDEHGLLYLGGRVDHQIKVRGYRVEPEEIESALRAIEGIDDALVRLSGAGQLTAYVTPEPDGLPTVLEVRRSLLKSLPRYMIPTYFVTLDDIPRLRTGKPNRRARLPFEALTRTDYNPLADS